MSRYATRLVLRNAVEGVSDLDGFFADKPAEHDRPFIKRRLLESRVLPNNSTLRIHQEKRRNRKRVIETRDQKIRVEHNRKIDAQARDDLARRLDGVLRDTDYDCTVAEPIGKPFEIGNR